jgi:hypothetical protein
MYRREKKSWAKMSERLEAKNDCAGEDQQQFNRPSQSWTGEHKLQLRVVSEPSPAEDVRMEAEKLPLLSTAT